MTVNIGNILSTAFQMEKYLEAQIKITLFLAIPFVLQKRNKEL